GVRRGGGQGPAAGAPGERAGPGGPDVLPRAGDAVAGRNGAAAVAVPQRVSRALPGAADVAALAVRRVGLDAAGPVSAAVGPEIRPTTSATPPHYNGSQRSAPAIRSGSDLGGSHVSISLRDRFRGGMLGLAVGDALGGRFEAHYAD